MKIALAEVIDAYLENHTDRMSPLMEELVRETRQKTGRLHWSVGKTEGKLLQMMVALSRASRVVEIGTFTGYSALMMAEALPEDGWLITCELNAFYAQIAQNFFDRSPHGKKIRLEIGPALDTLARMPAGGADFIFIDADKPNTPLYYQWAVKLARKGSLIIIDNVVREGAVLEQGGDENVQGMRLFFELAAADPRVSATALQTVGSKGHDGLAILLVTADP